MSSRAAAVLRSLYGSLQHLLPSLAILPRDQDMDRVRDARPQAELRLSRIPLSSRKMRPGREKLRKSPTQPPNATPIVIPNATSPAPICPCAAGLIRTRCPGFK
jgi:hypothetical protein